MNVVEAYEAATDTWTTKASMPTAAFLARIGLVNGVLYATGGSAGNGGFAILQAYEPVTDTWTTKPPMRTARAELGVVSSGRRPR
jgi:hypothetical protein